MPDFQLTNDVKSHNSNLSMSGESGRQQTKEPEREDDDDARPSIFPNSCRDVINVSTLIDPILLLLQLGLPEITAVRLNRTSLIILRLVDLHGAGRRRGGGARRRLLPGGRGRALAPFRHCRPERRQSKAKLEGSDAELRPIRKT